jgi:hypothetical protein
MSRSVGVITIEHNHGLIVLKEARWDEDNSITGIVVSGGNVYRSEGERTFEPLPVNSEYTQYHCDYKRITGLHTEHRYINCTNHKQPVTN